MKSKYDPTDIENVLAGLPELEKIARPGDHVGVLALHIVEGKIAFDVPGGTVMLPLDSAIGFRDGLTKLIDQLVTKGN